MPTLTSEEGASSIICYAIKANFRGLTDIGYSYTANHKTLKGVTEDEDHYQEFIGLQLVFKLSARGELANVPAILM